MSHRRPFLVLLAALTLAIPTTAVCAASEAAEAPASLYHRLGGYDAIAAVVDDFIGRLASDEQTGAFFRGASIDSQRRIRQLVVDQVCEATGGPCFYLGRSMKESHAGLGIDEALWQRTAGHLVASLDHFEVPEAEKNELLAIVTTLHDDIVE